MLGKTYMKNNQTNSNSRGKNFDLRSDAVDTLVSADSGEKPEYSKEELDRYRSKKGIVIPEIVKIVLIKAWFAGAVCYFFVWGLGTYISSMLDMLFILGVVLGMVTDLLVNSVLRFVEKTPGENEKWLMVSKKGFTSFFLNIVYSFVIIACVYLTYFVINSVITGITGDVESVPLGVEPILFGVFCMGYDMLFVLIKHQIRKIFSKVKAKAGSRKKNAG